MEQGSWAVTKSSRIGTRYQEVAAFRMNISKDLRQHLVDHLICNYRCFFDQSFIFVKYRNRILTWLVTCNVFRRWVGYPFRRHLRPTCCNKWSEYLLRGYSDHQAQPWPHSSWLCSDWRLQLGLNQLYRHPVGYPPHRLLNWHYQSHWRWCGYNQLADWFFMINLLFLGSSTNKLLQFPKTWI